MQPFTLELNDFLGYTNKQVIADGPYTDGRKKFEINTSFANNTLKSSMRVIKTFRDTPSVERIYPVSTIEEGIKVFNEII